MATFRVALFTVWAFCLMTPGSPNCLIRCSCTDYSMGRTLLCMDMGRFPADIPSDFNKIHIENSQLTELPRGLFSAMRTLEFLWLNFNEITLMNINSLEGLGNLTELRLRGNKLSSVPWTAFQDTPKLKTLDLKHNKLDVLPENALRHLLGLTYLDLSFNHLSVITKYVFTSWPLYQKLEKAWEKDGLVSNVVLALHDNPWLCDCRLKGFVEFIRAVSSPIMLINSYLKCLGPSARAQKFFHEIQLKTCMKPQASAQETNVTLAMGANATLTCLVKARPDPTIHWAYSLKITRVFSVTETHVDEETIVSQLHIPALHQADSGVYTCTANNFVGNSSVSVLVNIRSHNSSAPIPSSSPIVSPDENVYIHISISKKTVYGIALEWYASTQNPAETWYTVHFGKYDARKKETIFIGPGINSYSVSDLMPVTKYQVCVTLKNHPPRQGQCIVFVTGSDFSEMEQRDRLIHIVVIVCAMLLAVLAGMYACTTEARFSCADRCAKLWNKRRSRGGDLTDIERQGTFDRLQATSEEGLCQDEGVGSIMRRRSEDKSKVGFAAQL